MAILDSRDLIVLTEDDAQKLLDAINVGGWTEERLARFRELGLMETVENLRTVLRQRRMDDYANS